MLRLGSMLHIKKDAWNCEQDEGTAVTVLSLAGTLVADLRLWVCVRG